MPKGRPIPIDNIYLIKSADDLPDVLSQWTFYNLLYDPGAGIGVYYSQDGITLLRLDAGGVPTTLAGLTDTDLTGQAQFDLLYNVDGGNWHDTGGVLQWSGTQLTINDYTFPAADGNADQILQTDGLGALTFVDFTPTYFVLSAINRVIGSNAGVSQSGNNVFLGLLNAGQFNIADNVIALGTEALGVAAQTDFIGSIAIGHNAGQLIDDTRDPWLIIGSGAAANVLGRSFHDGNTIIGTNALGALGGTSATVQGVTAIGHDVLSDMTGASGLGVASNDVVIGYDAGRGNVGASVSSCVIIGSRACSDLGVGGITSCVVIGNSAGEMLGGATLNVLIGAGNSTNAVNMDNCIVIGTNTFGVSGTTESQIVIGNSNGTGLTTGIKNIIIGSSVGITGAQTNYDGCVIIGQGAGNKFVDDNDVFAIEVVQSNTSNLARPFLYGNFLNGNLALLNIAAMTGGLETGDRINPSWADAAPTAGQGVFTMYGAGTDLAATTDTDFVHMYVRSADNCFVFRFEGGDEFVLCNDGTGPTIPGLIFTLQDAYDADTSVPQILINATPDPLTIDASVVGDIFAIRDTIGQDMLRLSTTGASLAGGSNAGNILTLEGALAGSADTGIVTINSPVTLAYNTIDNTTPAQAFMMNWAPTFGASVAYIGGCLQVAPVVTITTGTFIPATFSDTSSMLTAAAPGFSAFTFINELAVIRNSGNFNLMSGLVMNVGLTHERNTSGTSTTPGTTGVSFSPQTRSTVSGGIMTKTDQTAVRASVSFSTVAGATANLGTIRGLHVFNPAVALFQPAGGAEAMTALYGMDVNAIPFGGNVPKSAVRSNIAAASNARFLENIGGAESDFGAGSIHLNDNAFLKFGAALTTADNLLFWSTAESKMTWSTAFGVAGNPLYFHGTAADEWIFSQNSGGAFDIGIGFDVNAIVFGTTLPTPNSNNWFTQFAAPNLRQVQIGGEYSDVLWTAGGSIDVNGQAVSDLQAFKINSPAVILNGGTIQDISNLYVAAMPSFGATRTQALRVLGRARVDGHMNSGSQEPAQLTASQNDFQLGANNNQRTFTILDADADWNITGIDASFGFAQTGDRIYLYNNSAFDISLTHQDAASLAANRFICPEGLPYVIHQQRGIWIWYDDTGTDRWRVMATMGHLERTLHLSGDQFRKGATAPTDVTIGTTPTIQALHFDATAELASLYHSLPADVDRTQDIILRLQCSLSAVEVNLDTCDFTCDYTVPTLVGGAGIAKASTNVTGSFTAVTGRLAIGDMYELDITFVAGDATNPLAAALGIAFEIHLTNTTGVGEIDIVDGDFIYTALRS